MKVESFSGMLSIYNKFLKMQINNVEHDISNLVSDKIWNMGGSDILNTRSDINLKIRCESVKIARKYVKKLDPTFPVKYIVG